MARVGGLAQGDWNEEAEPEGFVGDGMELVDETGEAAKPAAAPKLTQVWAPLTAAAAPEAKKSEPYRPGGHQSKKQHDGYFPALGTQTSEPERKAPAEPSTNRFTELQTDEPEPVISPPQSEEKKTKKKKKKDWKTVEVQAVVATTQAQQELVTVKESEEMYKPKIVRGYAERSERRSDFPVSESDNIWRKAGGEPTAPAVFKPARRPEEPFRRGEDAVGPIRREETLEAKPEPEAWRSNPASSPPTAEVQAKEGAILPPRKFINTKKKTDETAPPAVDTWKAADQQAAQQTKPRVNMWEKGDPRV